MNIRKGNFFIISTKTKLFVYADEKLNNLVGFAGVKNPKDFDFDALFRFAMHKSGSKIEVA